MDRYLVLVFIPDARDSNCGYNNATLSSQPWFSSQSVVPETPLVSLINPDEIVVPGQNISSQIVTLCSFGLCSNRHQSLYHPLSLSRRF